MKTLNFKKNSWHHKLAKMADFDHTKNQDFCTYTRCVLLGSIFFSILATLAIFITGCVGDFLTWIFAMIRFGKYIEPDIFAYSVTVVLGVVALMAIFIGFLHLKEKRRERIYALRCAGEYVEPEPGFIAKAYESFKNKTCFKIELS